MFFKTCFTSPLKGNREAAYHHTIFYSPLFHCLQFPHLATSTPNGQPHSLQQLWAVIFYDILVRILHYGQYNLLQPSPEIKELTKEYVWLTELLEEPKKQFPK